MLLYYLLPNVVYSLMSQITCLSTSLKSKCTPFPMKFFMSGLTVPVLYLQNYSTFHSFLLIHKCWRYPTLQFFYSILKNNLHAHLLLLLLAFESKALPIISSSSFMIHFCWSPWPPKVSAKCFKFFLLL